jgi:hypothetical protein
MPSKASACCVRSRHRSWYAIHERRSRCQDFSLAAKDTIEDRTGFTPWTLKKVHEEEIHRALAFERRCDYFDEAMWVDEF